MILQQGGEPASAMYVVRKGGKPLETELISTASLAAPPRMRRMTDYPGATARGAEAAAKG